MQHLIQKIRQLRNIINPFFYGYGQKLMLRRVRLWQLATLALLTVGLVTACKAPSSDDSTKYASANVDPKQLTHTVQHAMGKTTIPESPQRVVTLDSPTFEYLLALDVISVGTLTRQANFLEKQLQETESIGSTRPNLERVLSLQPDLILGLTIWEDIYPQVSEIAPAVFFKFETSADWKEIFASVGKVVNRTKAVEEVMSNYRDRLERFKQQIGNPGKLDVSVVRVYPDRFELYQKNMFAGTILQDAGLSRPPSQRGEQPVQQITKEELHKADGDVIFIWTSSDNYENPQAEETVLKQLEADPLWSKLEAVQQGKVYQVNGSHWIGSGPIAANLIIDDLFRYLVEEKS